MRENIGISDKTRKVLRGRSGNHCTICKHELVVEATPQDTESVVGDECHIISAKSNDWPVAIIKVLRKNNEEIIRVNLHEL